MKAGADVIAGNAPFTVIVAMDRKMANDAASKALLGKCAESDDPLGAVERRLSAVFANAICDAVRIAFDGWNSDSVDKLPGAHPAQRTTVIINGKENDDAAHSQAPWICFNLVSQTEEGEPLGSLTVAVPVTSDLIVQENSVGDRPFDETLPEIRKPKIVETVPVDVIAVLARFPAKLDMLSRLAPGKTLPLKTATIENVTLLAGPTKLQIGQGSLGLRNGAHAVRLFAL